MVLAAAVVIGLAAGLTRAWIHKRPYQTPSLRSPWLVFFAFIPQLAAFYLPRLGIRVPDQWVPFILVGSQIVLLYFIWINRKVAGFWLLGAGLALNFLVIVLNGGMMPISPETVRAVYPDVPETLWQVGERLGNGKDIVLPESETRLPFLSDRFLLPEWLSDRLNFTVAFSLGDVLIALGVIWLLWQLGGLEVRSTAHLK